MDETALMAMGILMEESLRGALGQTGDLVFTEGEMVAQQATAYEQRSSQEVGLANRQRSIVRNSETAMRSGSTRSGKRRRLNSAKKID